MVAFNASALIRELRKVSGLSQGQLAEGICSRQTIVAIEKGTRKPDWFIFRSIMMKLGEDPEKFYSTIVSEEDAYIINKSRQASDYMRQSNFDAMVAEIKHLENDERFNKGAGCILLLLCKTFMCQACSADTPMKEGMMAKYGKEFNAEQGIKYAFEALKLLRPDFEINEIPNYFLSAREMDFIMDVAILYGGVGDVEKCIEIKRLLLYSMERAYAMNHAGSVWMYERYLDCIHNLALSLLQLARRYDEVLQLIEEHEDKFKSAVSESVYFRILSIKAYALIYIGRKQDGEELFKKFILYLYAKENTVLAMDMTIEYHLKLFEERFGYKFDLTVTVPW